MQLSTNLWLEKSFYIDIDHLGQLRVVGPGDHMYFGIINEKEKKRNYEVTKVFSRKNNVYIAGNFYGSKVKFLYPIIGDIRTIRTHSYLRGKKTISFYNIRKKFPDILMPDEVLKKEKDGKFIINFRRSFGRNSYGFDLILNSGIRVSEKNSQFIFTNNGPIIKFKLKFFPGTFFKSVKLDNIFKKRNIRLNKFSDKKEVTRKILKRSEVEIS